MEQKSVFPFENKRLLFNFSQFSISFFLSSFKYDEDDSGTITFEEFLLMMVKRKKAKQKEEEYIAKFRDFDVDGNGYISQQEMKDGLKKYAAELDLEPDEDVVIETFKEVNTNSNGEINYSDFVKALRFKCVLE